MALGVSKVFIENTGFSNDEASLLMPLDIQIIQSADITKSPVELGYNIMDYKVLNPIEVIVKAIIKTSDFDSVMGILKQMYLDRSSTTYYVQTKTDMIDNLILYHIDEGQESDKYDAVVVTLKFCQLILANVTSTPINTDNTNKIDTGNKSPSPSFADYGNNIDSWIRSAFNWAKNDISKTFNWAKNNISKAFK